MSKEDQRRERNRQAQRKHRESVKQQLEKYDRLRQSLQHPENGTNPSTHLADLRSGQQKFCPLPSAGVNPCMHPQSILPSLFPEVEVDQPIDPPSTEPNDPLSHRLLPSAGYAKRVYSSPVNSTRWRLFNSELPSRGALFSGRPSFRHVVSA